MRAEPAEESKFQWLARLGFVVRGLLYMLIAALVLLSGRTEDLTGALKYLDSGLGKWLLIVIAGGMLGYGLWRLGDAAFGMDSGRHHAKAWRRRTAAAFSGAIYLGLSYKALAIVIGEHVSDDGPQNSARTAMGMANGQLVILGAGAVFAVAALVQLFKAASCSFLDRLDDRARETWAKWMGRVGYGARGVVFAVVAYLLFQAGVHHDPAKAGGLEQALDVLSSPLRFAVALGLMVFGAYSFVEARFRSIHKPPVEVIKNQLQDAAVS